MEQRASLEPPEEEEEESPVVNGNGVAITPGTERWERNNQISSCDGFFIMFFDLLDTEIRFCFTSTVRIEFYNIALRWGEDFVWRPELSPGLFIAVSLAWLSNTRERNELS